MERFTIMQTGNEFAVVDNEFLSPVVIAGHGDSGEREAERLCRAWNQKGPERRRAELSRRPEDIALADRVDQWILSWQPCP